MTTSETTTAEVVPPLRKLEPRFLDGLTPSEVTSIVAAATGRRFPAHSVITHEGHSADHLFLMIRGRARSFCLSPQGKRSLCSGFRREKSSAGRHSYRSQLNSSRAQKR
jgi:CRP-like cAMP-binding protein